MSLGYPGMSRDVLSCPTYVLRTLPRVPGPRCPWDILGYRMAGKFGGLADYERTAKLNSANILS